MRRSDDYLLEADILSGISEYLLDQEDGAQFRIEQEDEEEAAFRMPPGYFPGLRRHIHRYNNRTRVARAHDHRMGGFTGFAVNFLGTHIHRYMGVTSVDNNHRHRYAGWTDRAVGPQNTHVHNYSGKTSVDRMHDHAYRGRTGRPIRF